MFKIFAIFIKNVFGCCFIYIQTVKLEFTRRFSFVNLFAFVCELVCIYMWIFETPLTRLDSQMHFFQQGTFCSQSHASLVFSQSHDCNPTRGTSPWPEPSIFSAHFALLFGKNKSYRTSLVTVRSH